MSVVTRTFASIPARSAAETWQAIVEVLAPDSQSDARKELVSVAGVLSSIITRETPAVSPIVVHGGPGPRVRVYCKYGDDAIAGEGVNQSSLATTPTQEDWKMSIPCPKDDLTWVSEALKERSARIVARNESDAVDDQDDSGKSQATVDVNMEAYLRK